MGIHRAFCTFMTHFHLLVDLKNYRGKLTFMYIGYFTQNVYLCINNNTNDMNLLMNFEEVIR
ncbi:hypothetical protein FACS189451_05550 [Bacteroidia bacterium]|nr:hypothetical protein FACS189451_05550 [Bacteroidia bacterium]